MKFKRQISKSNAQSMDSLMVIPPSIPPEISPEFPPVIEQNQRKTALILSGGGARGAYEIGVWQALRELNVRIDMVFGTSVGAINGAMIVQDRFEEAVDLWKQMKTSSIFDMKDDHMLTFVKEAMAGGAETTGLKKLLQTYADEDSIRASPVDFGIVTTEFPSLEPIHMMKEQIPYGKIHDYILASAACFPAIKHHRIGSRKFVDGGYNDNLPVGMALKNGATHVIAVNLDAPGIVHFDDLKQTQRLKLIESPWDLGNFLVFSGANARRIMRLGYLETMKSYGIYEGGYYTFVNGQFPKEIIAAADAAAQLFELPAETLYLKSIFDRDLKNALFYEKQQGKLISRKKLAVILASKRQFRKRQRQDKCQDQRHEKKTAAGFLQKEILAAEYLRQL